MTRTGSLLAAVALLASMAGAVWLWQANVRAETDLDTVSARHEAFLSAVRSGDFPASDAPVYGPGLKPGELERAAAILAYPERRELQDGTCGYVAPTAIVLNTCLPEDSARSTKIGCVAAFLPLDRDEVLDACLITRWTQSDGAWLIDDIRTRKLSATAIESGAALTGAIDAEMTHKQRTSD